MANLETIRNGLSVNAVEEDQQDLITPAGPSTNVLQTSTEPRIRSLPTLPVLCLLLLFLVAMLLLPYLLPVLCPKTTCVATPLALLVYVQAVLWTLLLGFEFYLRSQHHKLRNYGYLEFYSRTRMLRRAPIIIWSAGSVCLLVVMAITEKHCTQLVLDQSNALKMIDFAKIIISLESSAVFVIIVKQLVETIRFNRSRTLPDIHQEEGLSGQHANPVDDVGFRDGTALTEVLERQTDLIGYLRSHNRQLGERLCELQVELDACRRGRTYQEAVHNSL